MKPPDEVQGFKHWTRLSADSAFAPCCHRLAVSQFFEPPSSETPSTKPQAPEKFQISSTKPPNRCRGKRRQVFELGAWCFFGAWSLEFGACCLGSQLLKN